jgi:hypothetical protein
MGKTQLVVRSSTSVCPACVRLITQDWLATKILLGIGSTVIYQTVPISNFDNRFGSNVSCH